MLSQYYVNTPERGTAYDLEDLMEVGEVKNHNLSVVDLQ